MALIYHDPANPLKPAYGSPEFKAMMQGYFAFSALLKKDGVFVSGEGLKEVATATTLRVRSGKVETMDGPFAETKEHLGGYYVMDVPDLDAALRYAAMIPTAAFGSIELRPVMDY
ncbi:MAG: YciI family protein [Paracoccaceae bacterium]